MVDSSPRFSAVERTRNSSPVRHRSPQQERQRSLNNSNTTTSEILGNTLPQSSTIRRRDSVPCTTVGCSSPATPPPEVAAAAASNLYANSNACCVPGCDALRAVAKCFVCDANMCSDHQHAKVRVVARLGTVDPVQLCNICARDDTIWRPDSAVTQCFDCSRQFMLFRRRHHCRVCGNVFCGDCTKYRGAVHVTHPMPKNVSVRMCLPCSDGLKRGLRCRAPTILRGNSHAAVTGTPLSAVSGSGIEASRGGNKKGEGGARVNGGGRTLDGVMDIEETESVGSDVFDRFCRARDEFISQSKSATVGARPHVDANDETRGQGRQSAAGATHFTPSVASDSSDEGPDEPMAARR